MWEKGERRQHGRITIVEGINAGSIMVSGQACKVKWTLVEKISMKFSAKKVITNI